MVTSQTRIPKNYYMISDDRVFPHLAYSLFMVAEYYVTLSEERDRSVNILGKSVIRV